MTLPTCSPASPTILPAALPKSCPGTGNPSTRNEPPPEAAPSPSAYELQTWGEWLKAASEEIDAVRLCFGRVRDTPSQHRAAVARPPKRREKQKRAIPCKSKRLSATGRASSARSEVLG
jgi:hypothetical protein